MSHADYLRELLSIQCEHAYGTVQRLKATNTLTDEDRLFLVKAQDVLVELRDRLRVVKTEHKEADDGSDCPDR